MANESKYGIRYSELRETYNMCRAIDILVSEVKSEPPPPVQSDSGEAGKGMGDYWGGQWVRMAELCRKQEKETKELREVLEVAKKENEGLKVEIKLILNAVANGDVLLDKIKEWT